MKIKGYNIIKTSQDGYNTCFKLAGKTLTIPNFNNGEPFFNCPKTIKFVGDDLRILFPEEFTSEVIADIMRTRGTPPEQIGLPISNDDAIVVDLTLTSDQVEASYVQIRELFPAFDGKKAR